MILQGLFAKEKGHKIPLTKLQPAPGNFDTIAEIILPKENALDELFNPPSEETPIEETIQIIPPEPEEPEDEDSTSPN